VAGELRDFAFPHFSEHSTHVGLISPGSLDELKMTDLQPAASLDTCRNHSYFTHIPFDRSPGGALRAPVGYHRLSGFSKR
jgi:hypothetical protein